MSSVVRLAENLAAIVHAWGPYMASHGWLGDMGTGGGSDGDSGGEGGLVGVHDGSHTPHNDMHL